MPGTRKLGRTSDHRKAMLRAMVTFLLENRQDRDHGRRAPKEVRAMAEKMITLGKRERPACEASGLRLHHQRERGQEGVSTRSARNTPSATAVTPASSRLVPRRGDAAEMAIIELV